MSSFVGTEIQITLIFKNQNFAFLKKDIMKTENYEVKLQRQIVGSVVAFTEIRRKDSRGNEHKNKLF